MFWKLQLFLQYNVFQMLQTPRFLDDASQNISPNLGALTQIGLLCAFYQEMLVKAAWTRIMLCASVGGHFMPCWVASTFVRSCWFMVLW